MDLSAFAARWKKPETSEIEDEDLIRKLVRLAYGDVELVNRAVRAVAGSEGNADLKAVTSYILAHRRGLHGATQASSAG